jgi:hypothetical protein
MEKLTFKSTTNYTRGCKNLIARRMIKFVLKLFDLNIASLQIRFQHGIISAST